MLCQHAIVRVHVSGSSHGNNLNKQMKTNFLLKLERARRDFENKNIKELSGMSIDFHNKQDSVILESFVKAHLE